MQCPKCGSREFNLTYEAIDLLVIDKDEAILFPDGRNGRFENHYVKATCANCGAEIPIQKILAFLRKHEVNVRE